MRQLKEILSQIKTKLEEAGTPSAELDACLLVGHVLGMDRLAMMIEPERLVRESEENAIDILLQRRLQREPLSHILGHREFWSLDFKVTKDTLIPRPDSETLIEAALKNIKDRQKALKLLDLGTGTGCLLLSLLSEMPQAQGLGIDNSHKALAVARENAENLGLEKRSHFIQSDWDKNLAPEEKFDLILCNPPYIALSEKPELTRDVMDYEPAGALFAGRDGLDDYRKLARIIPRRLSAGGLALLEIGHQQAFDVLSLLRAEGLEQMEIFRDLGQRDRVIVIKA